VKRAGFTCAALLLTVAPLLSGCSGSPSQNVLGSFFPAWLLCAALGVVAAIVFRQILGALGINEHLIAAPLTYVCISLASTLLIWLLWFGH
jgi:hypothetical protein